MVYLTINPFTPENSIFTNLTPSTPPSDLEVVSEGLLIAQNI